MSDPKDYDIHDLLVRADAPQMHFDLDRAVRHGKRARTRRRVAVASGAFAAVAAAAVAFGTLGGGGLGRGALPAGPTPSTSTSERVSADLLDGRYAVEVVSGAAKDQPNVILYSVKDGKRAQLGGTRAFPQVVSVGRTEADGVMLGVAPVRATQFDVIAGGAQGGISVDTQPLAGTEFQAIAIEFDSAGEAAKYSDIIWLDDKGVVRDSNAGPVDSALIPGTRDRAYADADLRRMGVFSDESSVAGPLFELPETVGVVQRGTRNEAANTWTWTATIALLTSPSTDPDLGLTWSPGTQAGPQVVIPSDGGLGPLFVHVTATRVGPDAPKLTSVQFRGYLDDKPRTFVVP